MLDILKNKFSVKRIGDHMKAILHLLIFAYLLQHPILFGAEQVDINRAPSNKQLEAKSILAVLFSKSGIPDDLQKAMLETCGTSPSVGKESGFWKEWAFGLSVRVIPDTFASRHSEASWISIVQMQAFNQMLKDKVFLAEFDKTGMTDSTALRTALAQVSAEVIIQGTVQDLRHAGTVQKGMAVGYACAPVKNITGMLINRENLQKIRYRYQKILYLRLRECMQRKEYQSAIDLWLHLSEKKMFSQALYLDAAKAYQKMGKTGKCMALLQEAMQKYKDTGAWQFFEQAGDLLFSLKQKDAEQLARACYEIALNKMSHNDGKTTEPFEYPIQEEVQ